MDMRHSTSNDRRVDFKNNFQPWQSASAIKSRSCEREGGEAQEREHGVDVRRSVICAKLQSLASSCVIADSRILSVLFG